MDQYIGRLLDNRYEILEIIGTGGMAVVYKARCHRLNRLVAIKILKDEFARDEEFRRRFRAEGEAVAMLGNPNIVQVYDVSSKDNANYIVMELIDGISLKQYMEKKGVLNWKETLHFGMQIAKALEHAHGRGIVHRDIKPHNVMVLKNGSVKVTDFGIARVMSKTNTLTKEALGSVHYISPEQAKGGWVDNRSDLYSLSVVMYEMMTGRPPYDGESPVAVAIQHINGGAAMPSSLNPNIPAGLEQIIMRGMALDVKDRYSSAGEMLRDMDEFRRDPGVLFIMPQRKISDDTQAVDLGGIARGGRTTAEKIAQSRSGEGGRVRGAAGAAGASRQNRNTGSGRVIRSGSGAAASRAAGMNAARRRRREQEEEEKRSRITTIAIVSCCTVAIIAIIILLIAIMNGGFGSQQPDLVRVPNLIGKVYADLPLYPDFEIEQDVPRYDENVPKGQIIDQNPGMDNQVVRGTVIKVVVSLGPEPLVKSMENLVGYDVEQAKAFLESQGYYVLVSDEPSDIYEEGEVISSDPAAGETLTAGQTIKLLVSSGPLIKKESMPNVVGLDFATAMKRLDDLGFKNVKREFVPSDAPKDEVVDQSVVAETLLDVTTRIVLKISAGPQESTEPSEPPESSEPSEPTESQQPTDPTESQDPTEEVEDPTDPQPVTVQHTIPLPQEKETYVLTLFCDGVQIMEPTTITPEQTSITVSLTGTGSQVYELRVNGELKKTFTVEFKVDG